MGALTATGVEVREPGRGAKRPTWWRLPLLTLLLSTLVAAWWLRSVVASDCESTAECIVVNGVPVRDVRYRGRVMPLQALQMHHPAVTVVAPLSSETGYIWAFDTRDEADAFNRHLAAMARECWVPGTCTGSWVTDHQSR